MIRLWNILFMVPTIQDNIQYTSISNRQKPNCYQEKQFRMWTSNIARWTTFIRIARGQLRKTAASTRFSDSDFHFFGFLPANHDGVVNFGGTQVKSRDFAVHSSKRQASFSPTVTMKDMDALATKPKPHHCRSGEVELTKSCSAPKTVLRRQTRF